MPRQSSTPPGPTNQFIHHNDTRGIHKPNYTGLQKQLHNTDPKGPLGTAYFSSANIKIIRQELYSQAVEYLRGTNIKRNTIHAPSEILIQSQNQILFPIYAQIEFSLDTSISEQVRAINSRVIPIILSKYLADIKSHDAYITSLYNLPCNTHMPIQVVGEAYNEPQSRSPQIGMTNHLPATTFQMKRVESVAHLFETPLPENKWLTQLMKH